MRVAVYYDNRDIRLEEWPRPKAGLGELLVRIEASGVCGSDVMEWYRLPKAPIVLGHEVAGVVEEVGEGVTRFAAGDRVVTTHHVPCNACRYCLTDRHSVCDTLRTTHFDPGGFSEYVLLPAINVERGTFHLPDHVSYEEGSFVEPLACVVRAQRLAGIVPGRSVAVLGSGISGILHIQLARALGAGPIVATDISDHRLESARRYGAAHAVRADEDVPAGVREGNAGRLADVVIVCTGALPAIDQAFRSVDRGGTVVLYAPADPGITYGFPLLDIWENGTNIVHSYAGPPADMRSALDLIAAGRLDVASMVTHRLGLAETGVGFGLVIEGGDSLKVIVEPQR
ncbi:MAG: alcohol dehydrogenase catalytic domain-containing protein [Gemmatimonadetes bacterium]|nr:alcohol dehydrogenase catalytic domain-containing protein [Gemmatimonadota bacterium]MCZ6825325.1 alcohol dehydrogenase catalytic domain-containing protein [Gemmatimonadota bacterium]